jgi:hypothetical protein
MPLIPIAAILIWSDGIVRLKIENGLLSNDDSIKPPAASEAFCKNFLRECIGVILKFKETKNNPEASGSNKLEKQARN